MFDKLTIIQRNQEELNSRITTVGKFIESQQQQTGKQMVDMLNELRETKRLVCVLMLRRLLLFVYNDGAYLVGGLLYQILSADEAIVPRVFIIKPENKDWSNPK